MLLNGPLARLQFDRLDIFDRASDRRLFGGSDHPVLRFRYGFPAVETGVRTRFSYEALASALTALTISSGS